MIYQTENQIKMILGINTWRNLLNDKLTRFTEMMPDIEPDVLVKLLGQLPQFWLLARTTLDHLEKLSSSAQQPIEPVILRDLRKAINYELRVEQTDLGEQQNLSETVVRKLTAMIVMCEEDQAYLNQLLRNDFFSVRTKIIAALSYVGGRL